MKKLIWVLLFCVAPLHAIEIAWAANKGGGRIVLTNDQCRLNGRDFPGLHRSFMYTREGYTMNSCFYVEETTVRMVYEDGSEMRYPAGIFTVRETKPRGSI